MSYSKKGEAFEHSENMYENFTKAAAYCGIDRAENARVRRVMTHFKGGGTNQDLTLEEFKPGPKKHNSMLFCRYLVERFQISYVFNGSYKCYRFMITEEMKEFAKSFFRLEKGHGGFYTAFLCAESIEINMA